MSSAYLLACCVNPQNSFDYEKYKEERWRKKRDRKKMLITRIKNKNGENDV